MTELSIRVDKDQPTLRERTTDKLRAAVFARVLKPGQRLIERDLCEQTGVSRTCVREALQHLEAEGLVVRQSGRGYLVASISREEARQIYEVRAALEPAMGRLFTERAGAEEIDALARSVDDISAAIERADVPGYVAGLDRFYDVMLRGARNDTARRIIAGLKARINFLRSLTTERSTRERERKTAAQLGRIAKAAARRDADDVARLCEVFVKRSAEFALRVLDETDAH